MINKYLLTVSANKYLLETEKNISMWLYYCLNKRLLRGYGELNHNISQLNKYLLKFYNTLLCLTNTC